MKAREWSDYIKEVFKRYHTYEYMPFDIEQKVGFCVNFESFERHKDLREFFKNSGIIFYDYREKEKGKVEMSHASDGTEVVFHLKNFDTFEELKELCTKTKEFLNKFLMETVFINDAFIRGSDDGEGHEKVVELYKRVREQESKEENKEKRRVFNQIDNLGKFKQSFYDRDKIRKPYGRVAIDIDIDESNDILIEKVHLKKPKDLFNDENTISFKTEVINVFDGLYTTVLKEENEKDIEEFFKISSYTDAPVHFDVVKTSKNETKIQGIYTNNFGNGQTYAYFSTDTNIAKKEDLSAGIKIGITNKLLDI